MALKMRLKDARPVNLVNDDASIVVVVQAFDTAQPTRVIDEVTMSYSGKVFAGMTANQIASRINTDAQAWAAERKATLASSPEYASKLATWNKMQALIGVEVDIA